MGQLVMPTGVTFGGLENRGSGGMGPRILSDPDTAAQIRMQGELGKLREAGDTERARIGANAAMLPAQLGQARFNTVFPWLQGQYGALAGSLNGGMATAGGASGARPEISGGPVLNSQQVQQQVNAARSGNDQATGGLIRDMKAELAGRGFGSNSPLAMALQAQTQGQNMATNTGNERDIRLGAAQQNAGQLLRTQQAREQQFATAQDEDIRRRQPYFAQQNALLSMLGGLV